MFRDLKPSNDMVSVDNPVLMQAPAHWDVRPMRTLIRARAERNRPDLPLLSVARERGVFVRSVDDDNHNVIPEDLTNYKVARQGDLVINKMKAWQGSLGIAPVDGIVSPAYYVYELALANRFFGEALLRSKPYVALLGAASDGVRIGQWDLSVQRFRELPVLVPPADEQAAIVRYLAHTRSRIDRAISVKRKLIALLEEQKHAVIHQAVTRGLDPTTPLRNSGVPLLGKIPSHWSVSRVGREFDVLDRLRVPLSAEVRGEMTSRVYDYYGASGVIDKVDGYLFDEPTILIAEDGANLVLRNLPLAIRAEGKYWVNNHAHILRPRRGDLGFLASLLETMDFRPWISGAAQPKLTQDRLKGIAIAIPSPDEQVAAMAAIEQQMQRQTSAIAVARLEMELLREYRTRLTSDVVTGQADVRKIAATLPEFSVEMLSDSDAEDVETIMDDAEGFLEEVGI